MNRLEDLERRAPHILTLTLVYARDVFFPNTLQHFHGPCTGKDVGEVGLRSVDRNDGVIFAETTKVLPEALESLSKNLWTDVKTKVLKVSQKATRLLSARYTCVGSSESLGSWRLSASSRLYSWATLSSGDGEHPADPSGWMAQFYET